VIVQPDWYLYCLAERPVQLATPVEARGHSIATAQDDVGEQYLLAHGFTLGCELQSSNKYEQNYRKLKVNHAKQWISDQLNATYLMRLNGGDPATTLPLPIPELSQEGLSMAFSRNIPDELVKRFRAGLEAIHQNGTYDAIMQKCVTGAAR
jgi:polar amino acid transport system substrate-binding protein